MKKAFLWIMSARESKGSEITVDIYYNAEQYLIIGIACVMSFMIHRSNLLEKEKKRQFMMVFFVITVGAIAEWCGVYFDKQEHSIKIVQIIVKSIDHSIAPVIALVLVRVVKEKIPKWLWILLAMHAFLEVISGKFGFIYYITEDGIYKHGSCYWIYMAFYLLYSVYFVVEYLKFGKKYQEKNYFLLAGIVLFLILGMAISMLNSELRITYMCVAIAGIMMYNYYTEIVQCTDVLTRLLNRRCYEAYVGYLSCSFTIFLFDVDDFKNVNDSYGHEFGDVALKKVGSTIKKVYQKYGNCYRIGGDEFAVIAPWNVNNAVSLNAVFFEQIDKARTQEPRLPFVSVGFAVCDPAVSDFETALKEADQNMYKWKLENKSKRRHQSKEETKHE